MAAHANRDAELWLGSPIYVTSPMATTIGRISGARNNWGRNLTNWDDEKKNEFRFLLSDAAFDGAFKVIHEFIPSSTTTKKPRASQVPVLSLL